MDEDEEDSTGAIDVGISSELSANESRFASLGEEELQLLLDGRLSKCTKQTISYALKILSEYSRAKGKSLVQVELMSVNNLQSFLGAFYLEIRKTDGVHYSRTSLITIRYGLQLHFKKHHRIDIINDCEFQSANEFFKAALIQLKKLGKGSIQHKKPLTTDDFNKLYSSDVLIMAVSGQKSEASIRSYSRNIAEQTRRDMSKTLSSLMFSTRTGDHDQPSDGNQSSQNQTISQKQISHNNEEIRIDQQYNQISQSHQSISRGTIQHTYSNCTINNYYHQQLTVQQL